MSSLKQDAELFIHNCGYRIDNDRVMISIERIGSSRTEDNMSGTLCIQLSAFPSNSNDFDSNVLASTTIGEIRGQHFIPSCHYDLVFQPPSVGSWQLVLQLGEWDGMGYVWCDSVYFETPYQVFTTPDMSKTIEIPPTTEANLVSKNQSMEHSEALELNVAPKIATDVSKNHLIINKITAKTLRRTKGVSKKVLDRLITERPFQSEKAILSVKGMGPAMLKKLLTKLTN